MYSQKMAPESHWPSNDDHQYEKRHVNLYALAGSNAPRLKELENLPEGFKLIGVGKPTVEAAGTSGGMLR